MIEYRYGDKFCLNTLYSYHRSRHLFLTFYFLNANYNIELDTTDLMVNFVLNLPNDTCIYYWNLLKVFFSVK